MADNNLKYCPKCGTKLAEHTNFCSNCGYLLVQNNSQQDSENTNNHSNTDSQTGDSFNESSHPGLITSTKLLYKDAFTLNKRLGRADYWWGYFGMALINFAILIILFLLFQAPAATHIWWSLLASLAESLTAIASFSAIIRRLHDVNVSPGLILLNFILVIGNLIVLFFLVSKSNNQDNHYPKSSTKKWTSWKPSWAIIIVSTLLFLYPTITIGDLASSGSGTNSFYNTYVYDDDDAVTYVTKKLKDKDVINDNSKVRWSEKYQAIIIPSKDSTLSQLEMEDYVDWEPMVTEIIQISKKLTKNGHGKYSRIYMQNSHNKSLYLLRVYKGHKEYDVENDD